MTHETQGLQEFQEPSVAGAETTVRKKLSGKKKVVEERLC